MMAARVGTYTNQTSLPANPLARPEAGGKACCWVSNCQRFAMTELAQYLPLMADAA